MALDKKLIQTIKKFEAVSCIGPSSLRGQGGGVIGATRTYLEGIKLGRIPKGSQRSFSKWLDRHTEGILDSLPIPNRPWGAARKALNLFLRSALYNHYLRKTYGIRAVERWLEVPVDSLIADALKEQAPGREKLRRWPGLKHLTPKEHAVYQQCAKDLARKKRLPATVFLDNYLWLENRG
ncbi:MAG: hypothetical protein JXL80_09055 [Planctomycetes bacterium]|nr:hypothetical protein [Planctomycetota bacterium]